MPVRNRMTKDPTTVQDTGGTIEVLTDVTGKYEGRTAIILSTHEYAPARKRTVYLRIYDNDRSIISDLIREPGEQGTLIYLIDHLKNKPQIFNDMKA